MLYAYSIGVSCHTRTFKKECEATKPKELIIIRLVVTYKKYEKINKPCS